jgi:hypothetical protein
MVKNALSKQSHKSQKFAQTGHPATYVDYPLLGEDSTLCLISTYGFHHM